MKLTDYYFDADTANEVIPYLISNCKYAELDHCPDDCLVLNYCNLNSNRLRVIKGQNHYPDHIIRKMPLTLP